MLVGSTVITLFSKSTLTHFKDRSSPFLIITYVDAFLLDLISIEDLIQKNKKDELNKQPRGCLKSGRSVDLLIFPDGPVLIRYIC